MSTRSYTRIPPRSTGDRVQMAMSTSFDYKGKTADFAIGDIITGQTSGWVGEVEAIDIHSPTTGSVFVKPSVETINRPEIVILVDEVFVDVDVVNLFLVDGSIEEIYTNNYNLVSSHNSQYGQRVGKDGAARVEFKEGAVEIDAFGRTRTGGVTMIAEYTFAHSNLLQNFTPTETLGGTVTHDYSNQSLLLTTPTANGAESLHKSDLYHHYIPGVSTNVMMTVACGDVGKPNLERYWGYFDVDDGLFFNLSNTTVNVGIRSSTSGTPVDQLIAQSDWNVDKLDGSDSVDNPSGAELNISKDNIFWFDFQWLGAGRVRFGIFHKGKRIVVHEDYNAGEHVGSYMKTGSLPISFEQINNGAVGSTSEMRAWACGVFYEATVDMNSIGEPRSTFVNKTLTDNTETPLLVIRPKLLFNGSKNTSLAQLHKITASALDTVNIGPGYVKLRLYQNSIVTPLASPPWEDTFTGLSPFEFTTDFSIMWNGIKAGEFYAHGIGDALDLHHDTTWQNGSLKIKGDGSQPVFLITAERMIGVNPVVLDLNILTREVIN